jgi:transposase
LWFYEVILSHCEDIRKAALSYVDEGGLIKHAVKIYKISRSSFQRWRNKLNETGTVEIEKRIVEPYKLKDDALKDFINLNPDAYISEIAEHFEVSTGCVSTALKRLNITRKKKERPIKKVTNKND